MLVSMGHRRSVIIGVLVLSWAILTNASLENSCQNPILVTESFSDYTMPKEWTLIQSHVHQRHWDRWMYVHDLIRNKCWPNQLNSTDPKMKVQCNYNISSVWQDFSPSPDPYSEPYFGNCFPTQLTKNGIQHAKKLGEIIRNEYFEKHKLLNPSCPPNQINIETDSAQKAQLAAQNEYLSMCDKLPDTTNYPFSQVVDNSIIRRGSPFWLLPDICGNPKLKDMEAEALNAYQNSIELQATHQLALKIASFTNHTFTFKDSATFLDNMEDCLVCHYCHDLEDIPTQLPTLFDVVDQLETVSRTWPFSYFKQNGHFYEYSALIYGPYFKVLYDRIEGRVCILLSDLQEKTLAFASSYPSVTSDNVLTTQLRMLGLDQDTTRRPAWGSTIAYELYQNQNDYAVRVLYNGKTMRVCGDERFCSWEEFKEKILQLIPTQESCKPFYNNYP